eukprot:COSAG02_NODE_8721_length_2462_cov_6.146037_1_plen_68_part_10
MAFAIGRETMFRSVSNVGGPIVRMPETAKQSTIRSSLERGLHALGYIMSLYQDYYDAQARGNAMYKYI